MGDGLVLEAEMVGDGLTWEAGTMGNGSALEARMVGDELTLEAGM